VRSRGSSVSIVTGYGLDDRATEVRSPAGARIIPLTSVSRPALGPTQPPAQCVLGVLSLGLKRWPLTPIYYRGREWVGAIPPLPPSASRACSGTALLYLLYWEILRGQIGGGVSAQPCHWRDLDCGRNYKAWMVNKMLPVSCMSLGHVLWAWGMCGDGQHYDS
jgi:hypothetical protein